jgi:hypothetical protein
MNESNFRDELREVWVPKDSGELEGLLLTIQNEPGKKILKHKIQQTIEKYKEHRDWDFLENYPYPRYNKSYGRSWPNVHRLS